MALSVRGTRSGRVSGLWCSFARGCSLVVWSVPCPSHLDLLEELEPVLRSHRPDPRQLAVGNVVIVLGKLLSDVREERGIVRVEAAGVAPGSPSTPARHLVIVASRFRYLVISRISENATVSRAGCAGPARADVRALLERHWPAGACSEASGLARPSPCRWRRSHVPSLCMPRHSACLRELQRVRRGLRSPIPHSLTGNG